MWTRALRWKEKASPRQADGRGKVDFALHDICLTSFFGFANFYAAYVEEYARLAAPLLDKLRVGKFEGGKGLTVRVK